MSSFAALHHAKMQPSDIALVHLSEENNVVVYFKKSAGGGRQKIELDTPEAALILYNEFFQYMKNTTANTINGMNRKNKAK